MHMHFYVCMYARVHVCVGVGVSVCVYVKVCVYVYILAYLHVCVYVCVRVSACACIGLSACETGAGRAYVWEREQMIDKRKTNLRRGHLRQAEWLNLDLG